MKAYVKERLENQQVDTRRIFITHSGVTDETVALVKEEISKYQQFDEVYVTRARLHNILPLRTRNIGYSVYKKIVIRNHSGIPCLFAIICGFPPLFLQEGGKHQHKEHNLSAIAAQAIFAVRDSEPHSLLS